MGRPVRQESRHSLTSSERDHGSPCACHQFQSRGGGERCYGAGGEDGNFVAYINRWSAAMPQPNDLSRSLVALDQDSTIIAVVEMSQASWLVGGILPGIERQPCKKLEPNPERLLGRLYRWRDRRYRLVLTSPGIALG